jgi:hypothetical protein
MKLSHSFLVGTAFKEYRHDGPVLLLAPTSLSSQAVIQTIDFDFLVARI